MALLLLVSALVGPIRGLAEATLQSFELHYRNAEQILPQLRPLLPKGVVAGGHGDVLFIRATAQQMVALRSVVARLDQAEQTLRIRIRQGFSDDGPDHGVYDTRSLREPQQDYSVLTGEGQWAQLAFGREIPLPTLSAAPGSAGGALMQGITYHTMASGLQVRATRLGDSRIRATLRPYRREAAAGGGGVIAFQELTTTVTLPFDRWVPLVTLGETTPDTEQTTRNYSTRRLRERPLQFLIRVERGP